MTEFTSKKQLRQFGLIVGFLFPLLIGWIIPIITSHSIRYWTLIIGLPLIFLAFLAPNKLLVPYQYWMRLGHALGWINSRIILGLVFLLVLLPISLFMRIFGYDPLKLKWLKDKTYRELRVTNETDLNRIF